MSQKLNDTVFYGQIVLALLFWGFQMEHMLNYSTRGLSTSMFAFTGAFIGISLFLAIGAHRAQPSRVTTQVVWLYSFGTVIYVSFLWVLLAKTEALWDVHDTLTGIIVGGCIATLLLYASVRNIPKLDPLMRGAYSLVFKAIPQTIMAWKIFTVGGQGLNLVMIVTFHILTISRIFQVWQTVREAGWDRNRTGLLLSEIGNEISWSLVTIAWATAVL